MYIVARTKEQLVEMILGEDLKVLEVVPAFGRQSFPEQAVDKKLHPQMQTVAFRCEFTRVAAWNLARLHSTCEKSARARERKSNITF